MKMLENISRMIVHMLQLDAMKMGQVAEAAGDGTGRQ
jgi:hypothetical protein